MCGIIGVASSKPSVDKLLIGLLRQEYRGYDSAGLAIFDETEQIQVFKAQVRWLSCKILLMKIQ